MTALIKEQPTKDNTITYINNSNSYSLKQQQQSYHCKHHLSTKNDILTKKLSVNNSNSNPPQRHQRQKEQEEQYQSRQFHSQEQQQRQYYHYGQETSKTDRYKKKRIPIMMHEKKINIKSSSSSPSTSLANNSFLMLNYNYYLLTSTPIYVSPFLMHGKWLSTYLPMMSFILIMTIRRNHWGIIIWEYLVLLQDSILSLIYYRIWSVVCLGPGWILTWEIFKFSIIAGVLMICWWSFWTFQIQGVLWKKELEEGVVVWSSDGRIMKANGIIRN
ncbi:9065_t:CDS:2 [Entrophospora sp. SA101]|nr:9065_t:CDS:2 [Entrophospora sp. SA101]CAJ0824831.1 12967_t:CDS:2 [Entrophospora sp. SA101]